MTQSHKPDTATVNELSLLPTSFVVFVDESGDEGLCDLNHPVFALGACTTLASVLDVQIRQPWRRVRETIAGNPDATLHAAALPRPVPASHIEAISTFFQNGFFGRIAAVASVKTHKPDDLSTLQLVARTFANRVADIARWTPFSDVKIVFEHSQRLTPLLEAAFSGLSLMEGDATLPVEHFVMPKSAGEPALEVADFIAHAVGRQARRNVGETGGINPDFQAIFHRIDQRLVSYVEIDSAVWSKVVDNQSD